MSETKKSSLRPLIFIGIGILGFGLFLLWAFSWALLSNYIDWIYVVIVGFPIIIGSFLILLGTK
jgi:hypothetical protein